MLELVDGPKKHGRPRKENEILNPAKYINYVVAWRFDGHRQIHEGKVKCKYMHCTVININ